MELTDREWELLLKRLDKIDGKLENIGTQVNGVRIWRARVTGALYIIGLVLIPLIGAFVKSLF